MGYTQGGNTIANCYDPQVNCIQSIKIVTYISVQRYTIIIEQFLGRLRLSKQMEIEEKFVKRKIFKSYDYKYIFN